MGRQASVVLGNSSKVWVRSWLFKMSSVWICDIFPVDATIWLAPENTGENGDLQICVSAILKLA